MKDKIVKIIDHQIEMEASINELFDTDEWWLFQKLGEKTFSNHTIRSLLLIKEKVQKMTNIINKTLVFIVVVI